MTRVDYTIGDHLAYYVEYGYNADDQLVSRAFTDATIGPFGTETEHYVYNGGERVLALADDGDLQNRYTWGAGVDQLLADEVLSGVLKGSRAGTLQSSRRSVER